NFVQPERATEPPRAQGIATAASPASRSAGISASFVLAFATYWVNGNAAQANASVTARRRPASFQPIRASSPMQARSMRRAVRWAAGTLLQSAVGAGSHVHSAAERPSAQ